MLPVFSGVYSLSHWGIWFMHATVCHHIQYGKSEIVIGLKQKGNKGVPLYQGLFLLFYPSSSSFISTPFKVPVEDKNKPSSLKDNKQRLDGEHKT